MKKEGLNNKTENHPIQLCRLYVKPIDRKELQTANDALAPKIEENQRMLAESSRLGAKFFVGS